MLAEHIKTEVARLSAMITRRAAPDDIGVTVVEWVKEAWRAGDDLDKAAALNIARTFPESFPGMVAPKGRK